jgi:hypothetical protein
VFSAGGVTGDSFSSVSSLGIKPVMDARLLRALATEEDRFMVPLVDVVDPIEVDVSVRVSGGGVPFC